MALPKFDKTPTPLFQQQPIIKRTNGAETYLKSFMASQATSYQSFKSIADRIDKWALKKEKEQAKEDADNQKRMRNDEISLNELDGILKNNDLSYAVAGGLQEHARKVGSLRSRVEGVGMGVDDERPSITQLNTANDHYKEQVTSIGNGSTIISNTKKKIATDMGQGLYTDINGLLRLYGHPNQVGNEDTIALVTEIIEEINGGKGFQLYMPDEAEIDPMGLSIQYGLKFSHGITGDETIINFDDIIAKDGQTLFSNLTPRRNTFDPASEAGQDYQSMVNEVIEQTGDAATNKTVDTVNQQVKSYFRDENGDLQEGVSTKTLTGESFAPGFKSDVKGNWFASQDTFYNQPGAGNIKIRDVQQTISEISNGSIPQHDLINGVRVRKENHDKIIEGFIEKNPQFLVVCEIPDKCTDEENAEKRLINGYLYDQISRYGNYIPEELAPDAVDEYLDEGVPAPVLLNEYLFDVHKQWTFEGFGGLENKTKDRATGRETGLGMWQREFESKLVNGGVLKAKAADQKVHDLRPKIDALANTEAFIKTRMPDFFTWLSGNENLFGQELKRDEIDDTIVHNASPQFAFIKTLIAEHGIDFGDKKEPKVDQIDGKVVVTAGTFIWDEDTTVQDIVELYIKNNNIDLGGKGYDVNTENIYNAWKYKGEENSKWDQWQDAYLSSLTNKIGNLLVDNAAKDIDIDYSAFKQ